MRLQLATRHALFAILELAAEPDRQMSASDIAEKYGLSPNHLAKVLRTLGRLGMVEASRGVGGGYRFSGNAKRLNLLDVITVFEPIGSSTSGREPGDDTREGKALRRVLDEIEDGTRATLSSITIDTMLKIVRRTPAGDAAAALRKVVGG
ncbi:Rrf2 family transcriptional regulator [Rhodovulum sp. PH10]|uniref:Rrf2 family transcriptional regulator n=1 Tax=Rhodovulum sp. PH10 TaxID=1187851 RepID=UPI00027C23A9|nr:Rrf2 family transcriptional regulator [Rhodovulum sp. PH10]EJW11414.1 Rrf2 family transcriptional regulator [Rhodovulum sp. PH10]